MRWTSLLQVYLLAVVVYFIMMAALSVVSGKLYDRFQDALLYASDATSSSNTYMENVISINENNPNILSVTSEYALAILRLLFPVELVANGPKYWPYVLYQLCMTLFLIRGIRNYRNNNLTQNAALILFIGYVLASATFEVDFGSWIRHCAVTTPIVLLMSGICPTGRLHELADERLAASVPQTGMLAAR